MRKIIILIAGVAACAPVYLFSGVVFRGRVERGDIGGQTERVVLRE